MKLGAWMFTAIAALRSRTTPIGLLLSHLVLPVAVQTQFTYTSNSETITITGYTGTNSDLTIPDTIDGLPVYTIGDSAFRGRTSLTNITIGNNVGVINDNAFRNCNGLTSVMIPKSVNAIGWGVFYSCSNLNAITVDPLSGYFSSSDGVLFDKNQSTLIQCPGARSGGYAIPTGVSVIGDSAFAFCTGLTDVTIPDSVTNIEVLAFNSCTSLTNVTIGRGIAQIREWAFGSCVGLTTTYFEGNAPLDFGNQFINDLLAVVYYLPGTTGWASTFGGAPAVLWNPQAESPAFVGGRFGFGITGPTNVSIVVEASANLTTPSWSPVSTNTLVNGSSSFSDPEWTNYPTRFYRLRSP